MNVYELLDPRTGEVVFAGTPSECAEFCGGAITGFYGRSAMKDRTYHGYKVRDMQKIRPLDAEEKKLAAKWDAFCEPIRKKYGIPVRRGEDEC